MRKGTGSQLLSDSDAPAGVCRAVRESPKPLPGGVGWSTPTPILVGGGFRPPLPLQHAFLPWV